MERIVLNSEKSRYRLSMLNKLCRRFALGRTNFQTMSEKEREELDMKAHSVI